MTVFQSFQDLDEKVIKYMNEQHQLFLQQISSSEDQGEATVNCNKQEDGQSGQANAKAEMTDKSDVKHLTTTYEIVVRNNQIGIKCTRKNCRFRVYFTGTEVNPAAKSKSPEMTNIIQRMPFYISWHSYPIHWIN